MVFKKNKFISIIIIALFFSCSTNKTQDKSIKISGAFALYPMATIWAEEYKKINPDMNFDITAGGAGKGMTDVLAGMVDIGMVSREINKEEINKGAWFCPVAIDAVVPMINSDNPVYNKIIKRGLTKKEFSILWENSENKSWKKILPSLTQDVMINTYTRSDACGAAQTWALFLGKNQDDLKGTGVFGDPGIAEAVRKDRFGIGYNNINFAYDRDTRRTVKGLSVLPIDINENGQIDNDEKIYDTRERLTAAIAEGKYPSPPARKLYFVMKKNYIKPEIRKFITWILSDGQKFVKDSGYINLKQSEIKNSLDKFEK